MEITLNAFDLQFVAMFAERQRVVKRAANIKSRKYDKNKTEYELHYIGALGELAIRKATGSKMDTNVYSIGDQGIDMVVNGVSAQIKTFAYGGKTLDFFIDDMEQFKAPVCIGVQLLSPVRLRIMGYIGVDRFERIASHKNYGYGSRLCVPDSELKPLSELKPPESLSPEMAAAKRLGML